jgi:GNAT superfamily N-acetyltransferase
MTAKVIQGSFLGGQPKLPPPVPARLPPPIQAKTVARPPGSPAPPLGYRPPGPPAPAFAGRQRAVQRHGSGGAFAVEAGQVGLSSGGGRPLPEPVSGKMEAALGANFADVRVHVGPQAERIGAIAFTLGSDIYFAPGRFQPDTVHGQQLLGHELAHVVQQRAGRVRNPLGSGIAVVQDHVLEAEADRLGRHAAAHRVAAQPKTPPGAVQPSAPVRISQPVAAGPGSYRLTAGAGGRQVGSVMVHARDRGMVEVTDLGVDQTQRGRGIGQMLVASAAKAGQQFGKSKVTLAAQDKGNGHLTQWYKQTGFTQTGVNQRGFPQLEAPIRRVLAGTAQRKVAWRGSSTLQAMEAQQPQTPGKRVIADLTNPGWRPPDPERNSYSGKKAITGTELEILLKGAAIAAWKTYAYHATKSHNVAGIMTQGLDPSRGGTGASEGNATFKEHSRGHVHYTRSEALAFDYKHQFEGGMPFGRKDPAPAPAEVLQVVIPGEVVEGEEIDPDSQRTDRAYRTTKRIPGQYIRRTEPVPLPAPRQGKKGRAEPLVPNANSQAWRDHVYRGFHERGAFLSHITGGSSSATGAARDVLYDVMKRGLDVDIVLQMVVQALRSMSTDEILEYTKENREANPRVNQSQTTPMGNMLPLKGL